MATETNRGASRIETRRYLTGVVWRACVGAQLDPAVRRDLVDRVSVLLDERSTPGVTITVFVPGQAEPIAQWRRDGQGNLVEPAAPDPMDPFVRLAELLRSFNLPNDEGLRDVMPRVWPTVGDLKELIAARLRGAVEVGPGIHSIEMDEASFSVEQVREALLASASNPFRDLIIGNNEYRITFLPGGEASVVLKGPAAPAGDFAPIAPKLPPMSPALVEILGRPNFACAELAMALRADGHEIKRKVEHEQAAVLHWMLGIYLEHGDAWHDKVGIELTRIAEAARPG